jgi:parallel beta-helix repeat protein
VATEPTPASELDHRLRRLEPGWRFAGRYRMENLIGRGGMGVVWRAQDETLDRTVALKFLVETLVHDPMAIDDLKRETRRALELTHHNIVRVYDFVEDRGESLVGIAMEFFPGQTLAARRIAAPTRCFEPETLIPWLTQLCDAMAYAHEKIGVIHRDLKPQNLMIDDCGELKITDFGVARVASDSMTRISIGKVSGTPSYMSPQQARGEAATVTDDIYAIGATVFELLTSRPPFWQGNIAMQLGTITPPRMTERLRELTGIERAIPMLWEETIAACLEKESANRPRSARELANRLGIALPSTQFHPTPSSRAQQGAAPETLPSVDLAALQPNLDLEAPTMAGVTINRPTRAPRSDETVVRIPPPFPQIPKRTQPSIPSWLWITGIAITLAVFAFMGGAVMRRFIAKPEPATHTTATKPAESQPSGRVFVPDNFPTIQAAINGVPAGSVITVRPGVYRESLTLRDGIRLVGENPAACRIAPPEGVSALLLARGVRECTIKDLTLQGSGVAAAGARVDGIAISDSEVRVTGCIVRGLSGAGIVVHGSDTAAEITGNHIENNALHGILLLRTGSAVSLRNNEVRKNKGSGICFNDGASGVAEENVCEENGESGILAEGVSTSPTLQSNRCARNEKSGIAFTGAARGAATGNTCEENGDSGIGAFGEGTAPELVKNTARRNLRYGIYFGIGADGNATGNLCEQNQLSGIGVTNTSTRPALSQNQLVRNQKFGIESFNGASPRIAPDNVFIENIAGDLTR